jgi:hypothetical protein
MPAPRRHRFAARRRDSRVVRYGFMREENGVPQGPRNALLKTCAIYACALYAAITLVVMARAILAHSYFNQLEPYETTDSFLQVLDVSHPGLVVEGSFRKYATDQRFLFVGPASEPSTLRVYYTIAHLAYPRPVAAIFCGQPGKSPTKKMESVPSSSKMAGLIFYKTDPGGWSGGGTRVTPELYISLHNFAGTWESFCH